MLADYYIDLSSSCLALEYGKFLFQLLRDHPRDLIFFITNQAATVAFFTQVLQHVFYKVF